MNTWINYCIKRIKSLKALYAFAWEALTWQVLGGTQSAGDKGMRHIERLVNTAFMIIAPFIFMAAIIGTIFYLPILTVSVVIGGLMELVNRIKKPKRSEPVTKHKTSTAKITEVMIDKSPAMPALAPLYRPATPESISSTSRSSEEDFSGEELDSYMEEDKEEGEYSWWAPYWQ